MPLSTYRAVLLLISAASIVTLLGVLFSAESFLNGVRKYSSRLADKEKRSHFGVAQNVMRAKIGQCFICIFINQPELQCAVTFEDGYRTLKKVRN